MVAHIESACRRLSCVDTRPILSCVCTGQIAGLIFENYIRGRKKAICNATHLDQSLQVTAVRAGVSMSADLADDAARDLKDVGNMDSGRISQEAPSIRNFVRILSTTRMIWPLVRC